MNLPQYGAASTSGGFARNTRGTLGRVFDFLDLQERKC
jgi:hypothetical protein